MSLRYVPDPVPGSIGQDPEQLRAYLQRELGAIRLQFEQISLPRYVSLELNAPPVIPTAVYTEVDLTRVADLNAERTATVGWVRVFIGVDLLGSNATAQITIGISDSSVTDPLEVIDLFSFQIGNRELPVSGVRFINVQNGVKIWAKGSNVTIKRMTITFEPMTPGGN